MWCVLLQDASTEELQEQKKKLEGEVQPIISKLYQGAGGAPPPEGEQAPEDETKDEL